MIGFDQVESIVSSEKPQNSKKRPVRPVSFQHQLSKNCRYFSENINFIIKKAKYGSYSPFTKLTKSSNFELTFRD